MKFVSPRFKTHRNTTKILLEIFSWNTAYTYPITLIGKILPLSNIDCDRLKRNKPLIVATPIPILTSALWS